MRIVGDPGEERWRRVEAESVTRHLYDLASRIAHFISKGGVPSRKERALMRDFADCCATNCGQEYHTVVTRVLFGFASRVAHFISRGGIPAPTREENS